MSDASGLSPRPEVSVIIPCYNEEPNVDNIYAAVSSELKRFASSYEIIFIDNGSTDATRQLLRNICSADDHVRAIFNNRNYGQLRSPTYAIYQAEGEAVIAMCADFQDPPNLIGPFIEAWKAGAEVVLGQRRSEKASAGTWLSRKLGYAVLGRFSDYPLIPGATGFGLFSRRCVDVLAAWHEPEPFFRGMVVESGFRLVVMPFDRPQRAAGRTKNNFATLFSFAVSSLAASGKSLLRAPLPLSLIVGLIGGCMLIASIVAAFFATGWSPLLLLLAVQCALSAVTLLFLGIVGEQVRMISERTRNVPLVVEEQRLNFPADRQRPASRVAVRAGDA